MSGRSSQHLKFLIILLIERIYFKEPLCIILNIAGKEKILSRLPLVFIHNFSIDVLCCVMWLFGGRNAAYSIPSNL